MVSGLWEYEREVLRQASVALQGRIVTLWEARGDTDISALVSSQPDPPAGATTLDTDMTLKRWGGPIIKGSQWVGCRLDNGRAWCVARVRVQPAAPPPAGTERRSRERLVLELTGLCVGTMQQASASKRRLPPAEALWEHARQPSVIAHEVGNPLAVSLVGIDLAIKAIHAETPLDSGFRNALLEDLGSAADGVEQATDYLRVILERPFEAAAKWSRFDATPVVRSAVTLERPLARKKGVALTMSFSVESVFLYGTTNALYRVMTNLIRNAVDASADRKTPVVITLDRSGDTLNVGVQDRGVGIPPEARGRIFEPGFSSKGAGPGSGMGLAVVSEIVQNMFGGKVSVDSVPGVGSDFVLDLPIPKQRDPSPPAELKRQ